MKDLANLVVPSGQALCEEQRAFTAREKAPLFIIKGALLTRTVELLLQLLELHPPDLRTDTGHFGLREPELASALVSAVLGELGHRAVVEPIFWVFAHSASLTRRLPLVLPECRERPAGLGRWFVTLKIGHEISNYYLLVDPPQGDPVECSRLPLDFGSAIIHREPFWLSASICAESSFLLSIPFSVPNQKTTD